MRVGRNRINNSYLCLVVVWSSVLVLLENISRLRWGAWFFSRWNACTVFGNRLLEANAFVATAHSSLSSRVRPSTTDTVAQAVDGTAQIKTNRNIKILY